MTESGEHQAIPSPDEARAALTEAAELQHRSVDAAYDTPAWYFWSIGGLVLLLAAVYATNDWIEDNLGFPLAVITFIVATLIVAGGIGALLGVTVIRQRATPTDNVLPKRRTIVTVMAVGVGALAAAYGVTYAIVRDDKTSFVVLLVLIAALCGLGGRPLQRLIRGRAHRRLDAEIR